MSKKKSEKVERKLITLEDWLRECGNYAPLAIRIIEGVVLLHHAKTNEFYLVSKEKK